MHAVFMHDAALVQHVAQLLQCRNADRTCALHCTVRHHASSAEQ
jgi:hypothetical protein